MQYMNSIFGFKLSKEEHSKASSFNPFSKFKEYTTIICHTLFPQFIDI